MTKMMLAGVLLVMATTAAAQTAVGNPPGNTLAPATGTVTTTVSPPAAAPAGNMVPAKTPEQIKAEKYKTEIVCRTEVETGSLIAKRKTCLTRAQWAYVKDENERAARDFVHDNTSRPGSPN